MNSLPVVVSSLMFEVEVVATGTADGAGACTTNTAYGP